MFCLLLALVLSTAEFALTLPSEVWALVFGTRVPNSSEHQGPYIE